MEEAVGHVEGGAAPHLQGEAVVEDLCRALGGLEHVAGAHPGGEEGLVGVPHGGVGDEQLLLSQHPVPHRLWPLLIQKLLEAGALGRGVLVGREAGNVELGPLSGGVIHLYLGDVLEQLGGTVAAHVDVEELGSLVNELGVARPGPEGGVGQNVGDEGDVGLDAADMLLADGPHGLAAHPLEGVVPGGDLDQQGVVVGGDLRAGEGVAAVQTDAEAAAGAVGGDPAGVGGEVVGRILGGHPALEGVAVHVHRVLAGDADLRGGQGVALGDEDLGPYQVYAGDHLGDGVLHLDAGIHLDKVVVPALVHQELHRAGGDVAHVAGHLYRVLIKLLPGGLGHAEGGGELHHLLVAALEGAVPLEQVNHIAVLVAQNLHLNVLGLHQVLLDEDVLVAEGLFGLALHQVKGGNDLLRCVATAHPPAAAAAGRLEDDGEAVFDGLCKGLLPVLQGTVGTGDGGHAAGVGNGLGGQLVAHLGQNGGGGADEGDASLLAGPCEVGVLAQKAVAGVDGVHVAAAGQIDDGGDVQIGPQGGLVLTDEIGLVRLGAEEGKGILVGVHGHRVQAQIVAGPEHADGDLAPVSHQDLVKFAFRHAVLPS